MPKLLWIITKQKTAGLLIKNIKSAVYIIKVDI